MKCTWLLGLALAAMAGNAWASDYKVGSLEIDQPWSRATPKGAKVAGGYLKITNTGSTSDRLVGGTFGAARGFEVHEMSVDRGVMKMREIKGGLEIKPGGYHLMFTDLSRPLAKGEQVKGTLVFEKAGTAEVEYAVQAIGGTPGQGGHMGH
jgi:periplasmic copper chaperone A